MFADFTDDEDELTILIEWKSLLFCADTGTTIERDFPLAVFIWRSFWSPEGEKFEEF